MSTISAIIITKNEEELIADCLDSVSFCHEVVVIDSGSTDRTLEIAKRMNAKVFTYGTNSYADMRNYGLKKAKSKWILYIDADERVTSELKDNILQTISQEKNSIACYLIQRKNFYLGNNEWPQIEKLERLFRKNMLVEWYGELHESPKIKGETEDIGGFLYHYTHRNLTAMLRKTIVWSKTEAELRLKANHPKMVWWRFPRVMITSFYNSYFTQKGWKAGTIGIIESMYQAFSTFITYARLWEMQQKQK